MHSEWERSGAETLKILAKEHPEALAKLAFGLLPKQFDDEMPAVVRIITGVPRGDELPQQVTMPNLPPAPLPQIPAPKDE